MSAYTQDTFKNSDKSREIQMGCFLTCFGFDESSRKRRKPARKTGKTTPSAQQCHGRYVPLDPEIPVKSEIKEDDISGYDDELKEKQKGQSLSKIKKKVRFNLDVKAYEPLQKEGDAIDLYHSDIEQETTWEFGADQTDSTAELITWSQSSPANRYQNCRDDYEDEDEFKFHEDDLDFDDSDEDVYNVYANESDDEFSSKEDLNPVVINPAEEIIVDQITDEGNRNINSFGSHIRARDRGKYVFNVLNPVEDLTQWKAVKSKAAAMPRTKCRKENWMTKHEGQGQGQNLTRPEPGSEDLLKMGSPGLSPPTECTVAVDVSLSNWLGSVGTQTITRNSSSGQDKYCRYSRNS